MTVWSVLLLAQAAPPPVDPVLAPAASLYDELCLKAFPDDIGVDALMKARGATPLTADQVKVTLGADPGRGWRLDIAGRQALIFLELPPYHACSIRWPAPEKPADFAPYVTVTEPYQAAHAGFAPMRPYEADMNDLHISATGVERALPGGGSESLFVIEQRVIDPARLAKGETGIMRRFVHQIRSARGN